MYLKFKGKNARYIANNTTFTPKNPIQQVADDIGKVLLETEPDKFEKAEMPKRSNTKADMTATGVE